MKSRRLRFVFLGQSITSSWATGHATTYRGLMYELVKRGHDVLFLERDLPWYAAHRDLIHSPYFQVELYKDPDDLRDRFTRMVSEADVVILGSLVPDGIEIAEWLLA